MCNLNPIDVFVTIIRHRFFSGRMNVSFVLLKPKPSFLQKRLSHMVMTKMLDFAESEKQDESVQIRSLFVGIL